MVSQINSSKSRANDLKVWPDTQCYERSNDWQNGGRFLNKFSCISEAPSYCFIASFILYVIRTALILKVSVLHWAV